MSGRGNKPRTKRVPEGKKALKRKSQKTQGSSFPRPIPGRLCW